MIGHYAYYGITGNAASLGTYRYQVARIWRKWLDRRSRPGAMTWKRFNQLFGALPIAGSPDLSLCVCSETVTLRNRMRETCSSGSVGELVG